MKPKKLVEFHNQLHIGRFQPTRVETPITIEKCTTSGGRTKEAKEGSFVFVHQDGGDDIT